ncbi:MAG: carbamoyltransferase C-terminal domain-containing protein [Bryobacterales bacterium]|nr:carbamoyltransferase [Bryobacteraceae bacterium]MDW8354917.1 carbamoyltransferase C-terminal domain-containing protein [Bryobacterales bacterium]
MVILGLSGLLNDAACALLKDGVLLAAAEQRKLARYFQPGQVPEEAITACLRIGAVRPAEVDCVALVRPFASGNEMAVHLDLRQKFPNSQIVLVEHHTAHAASCYFASPFEHATVLTLDRAGDFRCGVLWRARGLQLVSERELYYPDSLGDLYGRVTELLGFKPNAEEHKVQWLSATTSDDRYVDLFRDILCADDAGWPRIDRSYFHDELRTRGGFSARFYQRLGLEEGAEIPASLHAPLAAGLQRAVEEAVLRMAGEGENLCLGGGLAFNALLVAAIERSGRWKNVFVQPAAGNAGAALGAVFYAWHVLCGQSARSGVGDLCLGPCYGPEEIKQVLENCKLRFRYVLTADELISAAVAELNDHKIVAWMHGRMEFGPRALGNRSILASPLNPYSTENLNIYIKHREPFRKFAASVPAELASEYFEVGPNARFLATVGRVRPAHRKVFESAILGADLVRVHTVSRDDNPLYWKLLHAFGEATGLPVLYNTSFNLFGDPLVCTPRDAVRSFYSSGIDSMFVGHFLLQK